jgi:hypothetical protein
MIGCRWRLFWDIQIKTDWCSLGDKTIREHFGHIWPRHVLEMTRFLIACRRNFDGDIDLFLVLCVIGERTFSQDNVRETLSFEQWTSPDVKLIDAENINVQSIADFSGIPRETVRRKLHILMDKGWVTRDEAGYVQATRKAQEDLAPLTEVSIRYLSQMKAAFDTIPG